MFGLKLPIIFVLLVVVLGYVLPFIIKSSLAKSRGQLIRLTNAVAVPLLIFCFLFPLVPSLSHALQERHYQDKWCAEHNGLTYFVMPDSKRADCVTDTHAIEFGFGKKWAGAIGQSLYYSLQTGKRAGIVLILEMPKDRVCWLRMNSTIEHFKLPIDTWEMLRE